ncbi:MAG TPA: DUF4124 domain-containing protein [Steroidobacteraceae bacterium]|jgi:hypothetical protein|nr:DUF4124 domain-containing protein [Steroidobacteraceae bacterium]
MLRTLAISSLLFVGGVSVANAADVFRWVDDHGGVHYSDQWVPGSEVIKSTRPHPVNTSSDSPRPTRVIQKTTDDHPAGQSSQAAEKAVKLDRAKIREQQCKEAKDRYDKAIQARRIYKPSEGDKSKDTDRPDDRQYLSEEEADAYRVKAQQDVQDLCGKSAK